VRLCIDCGRIVFARIYSKYKTLENIMKLINPAFLIITALIASVLVASAGPSHTEHFSASLAGANEVPPINSAGTADFDMAKTG
jgi:predicted aspartyl protease